VWTCPLRVTTPASAFTVTCRSVGTCFVSKKLITRRSKSRSSLTAPGESCMGIVLGSIRNGIRRPTGTTAVALSKECSTGNDSTTVFIFSTRMQSDLDCASSARSIAKSVSCSLAPFVFSSFVSWIVLFASDVPIVEYDWKIRSKSTALNRASNR